MMPDQAVRDHLFAVARELDERPQGGLRGLGMICRVSAKAPFTGPQQPSAYTSTPN